MAHHAQDVALLQMIKGCTLREDTANKLMRDLTAALLVRALRIAVEDSTSHFSKLGVFNGYRVGKFTAPVCQYDREQATKLLVSKSLIQPFKNLCDRPCGIPVSQKCQHEIRVAEKYRKQYLSAFTAFYRINLHDGSIRIGCRVFKEIFIGSAEVALLVYPYSRLFLAYLVANLLGQIYISHGQKSGIHIIVDGSLIQHDFVGIIYANLVNGMSGEIIWSIRLSSAGVTAKPCRDSLRVASYSFCANFASQR